MWNNEWIGILKESCEITLYSDSKYLVDAMTKGWLVGVRTLQALHDKLGDGLSSARALRSAIERFGVEPCR